MLSEMDDVSDEQNTQRSDTTAIRNKISDEIDFLNGRKATISLLLMEAMKRDDGSNSLFEVAEKVISRELSARNFRKTKRHWFASGLWFTSFSPASFLSWRSLPCGTNSAANLKSTVPKLTGCSSTPLKAHILHRIPQQISQ